MKKLIAAIVVVAAVCGVAFFGSKIPYTVVIVRTGSMVPNIRPNTMVFIHKNHYMLGQVISFRVEGQIESHRLMGFTSEGLTITKGDAVAQDDPWHVQRSAIIGGAVAKSQFLGEAWLKLDTIWGEVLTLLAIAVIATVGGIRSLRRSARRKASPKLLATPGQ